jgi:tetratricopeptide (TPR) repeat protein
MYTALGLRDLARAGHSVTVVSPENFMQYQPFLPEVASGTIDPRAVVVPLRATLRHAELVIGEVEALRHDERIAEVSLADGRPAELAYDIVVVAAGSWSRVLPIPGLAEHGVGFKTIQEAIFLRNRVLSRLDVAAESGDPARRRAALTFVVVGGGYAGVEALGELEDLARDAMRRYPDLDPTAMRWVLVEGADRILLELEPSLAAAHTNLGNLAHRRGAADEARRAYQRALDLDPDQPEARFNLANLLDEMGETELALAELLAVCSRHPSFADAHYNLGLLLYRLGGLAQARHHLGHYLTLDPSSEWSARARGLLSAASCVQ